MRRSYDSSRISSSMVRNPGEFNVDASCFSVLLGGVVVGAAGMYFGDPARGRRRRAVAIDKLKHYLGLVDDVIGVTARDLGARAYGTFAEARAGLSEGHVPDQVLEQRVRSRLGRAISHPRAVEVKAHSGGVVTLEGDVLESELESLVDSVRSVRGVNEIENELSVHRTAENIPKLQGGRSRRGKTSQFSRTYWSPTFRLGMGSLGGALLAAGTRSPTPISLVTKLAGIGLITRAVTNKEVKRLTGVGAGRRAVDFQKSITIEAPVDEVFDFWTHGENFPLFMSHIREVRELGHGRSHWKAVGPAGVSVQWNSVVTEFEPNEVLAWKSEPDSAVQHVGRVRFEETGQGGTRLHVELSYNPPGGALGHVVFSLLSANPKQMLDRDFVRLKSILEGQGGVIERPREGQYRHEVSQPAP